MCWKECDQVSLRREFVSLARVEGANRAALCRRFGIARKTGYKWLARHEREGDAGLSNRSRRPKSFRVQTSAEMEKRVIEVRDEHPVWGGRKIRARLQHLGVEDVPAASTITEILRREGRIDPVESAKRVAWQRFEREQPNELWQMDFKGEFSMTCGGWCYPLTVLDDHSRFSLVLRACKNQQRETVQSRLTSAFERYGLPRAMLMDNGSPWSAPHVWRGHTRLSVWLLDLDVAVLHGRPYHPQTQGKEERFHRTLKAEVLQGRQFDDLTAVQTGFDRWREVYNHERPHEALGLQVPASCYRVSQRSYCESPAAFEYDTTFEVRKVHTEGRIVFQNRAYFVGGAFAGRHVGIRSAGDEGQWVVYYRTFKIKQLDEGEGRDRRRGGAASARCARSSGPTTPT